MPTPSTSGSASASASGSQQPRSQLTKKSKPIPSSSTPTTTTTTSTGSPAGSPGRSNSKFKTMDRAPLFDPNQILPMNNPSLEKIVILDGHAEDYSACTFCLHEEDHTLGNTLRWMIMKNPDVEFCGYSIPHPSEAKIHLRIQMYDELSAITCLFTALANLRDLFKTVGEAYMTSLRDTNSYVRTLDTDITAEVNAIRAEGDRQRAAAAEQKARRAAVDLEGDDDGDDVEMA